MCGRYRLSRIKQLVDEYFGSVSGEQEWESRYNIAHPACSCHPPESQGPVRELSLIRWGFPANVFYEWMRTGKSKQPYCFEVNAGQLFAFAGIWDRWKDAGGNRIETCSILTTTPNAVTSVVHDRMAIQ
jgi:putative SOS response-associated peptidase YedK